MQSTHPNIEAVTFLLISTFSTPQIYAYVSLFFVILAIFSFCASTHSLFQINNHVVSKSPTYNTSSAVTQVYIPSTVPSFQNVTFTTNAANETNSTDTAKTFDVNNSLTSDTTFLGDPNVHPALFYIDLVCLVFFTAEYILKIIVAPNRCKFIISCNAIIDIVAILPDYVEIILNLYHPESLEGQDATTIVQIMPFLRLLRAFRIFRLIRRVPGLWIMVYTLKASFKELSLLLVVLIVGTLLFSSMIFFVDDPDVFPSIPHAFWWAIVTMTTVGYGDMAPVTMLGQVVGSATAVCGVLMIGFTIPSLVNSFITFYRHVDFLVQKEKLVKEHLEEEMAREIGRKIKDLSLNMSAIVGGESRVNAARDWGGLGIDFPHRRRSNDQGRDTRGVSPSRTNSAPHNGRNSSPPRLNSSLPRRNSSPPRRNSSPARRNTSPHRRHSRHEPS